MMDSIHLTLSEAFFVISHYSRQSGTRINTDGLRGDGLLTQGREVWQ